MRLHSLGHDEIEAADPAQAPASAGPHRGSHPGRP